MEWQPPLPEGYGDPHRAFLQAIMSRGTLTFEEAQVVIAAILTVERKSEAPIPPDSITQTVVDQFIAKAREAVSPLDYDIRSILHQVHKERVWAFINTHSDPSTQLATSHTPDEISYIKRLLDAMFETFNTSRMELMCITQQQAVKLARPNRSRESTGPNGASQSSSDRGLKHSEVLDLLNSLVAEGWLERSRSGFYSLTPRFLLELRPWLTETYNDPDIEDGEWQRIKFCEACKEAVTVGQRCSETDCIIRLHDICAEAFWRARRNQICPKCETAWDGKHFVGEKAVTETEAYQRSIRRKNGPRSSDVIDYLMRPEEEEEDDDDEAEDLSAVAEE